MPKNPLESMQAHLCQRLNTRAQDNLLPTGLPFGSPEDCLDCACYLCLGDQPA
ncbi:hypothetical protein [Streptomyces sp. NPDC051286]|uniref:hypothetical protein n=1 Tax=Streptomyces sp. NPDC051286 TaxID=3365647 RepID=UPI00379C457F